jgi:hypothetical protein
MQMTRNLSFSDEWRNVDGIVVKTVRCEEDLPASSVPGLSVGVRVIHANLIGGLVCRSRHKGTDGLPGPSEIEDEE